MPEQLPTTLEICDEVQVRLGLERELQADEEGALERSLQNLALADRMGNLLLLHDLALRQNLHGVYPLRVLLANLKDLAEGTTSDEFEEFEVAWRQSSLIL